MVLETKVDSMILGDRIQSNNVDTVFGHVSFDTYLGISKA